MKSIDGLSQKSPIESSNKLSFLNVDLDESAAKKVSEYFSKNILFCGSDSHL